MRLSNSANSVNCVTEDRFSRMLAPAGGLDLGPHCGRKSGRRNVRFTLGSGRWTARLLKVGQRPVVDIHVIPIIYQ